MTKKQVQKIVFISTALIYTVLNAFFLYMLIYTFVLWLRQPILTNIATGAISRPMGFFIQAGITLGVGLLANLAIVLPYVIVRRAGKKKKKAALATPE